MDGPEGLEEDNTSMKRALWAATAVCLLWTGPASAQTLDLADSHVALQQAHDLGWLDDGTYALYLTLLVHAPEQLPEAYRPMDMTSPGRVRCQTPPLLQAWQLRDAMTPDQQAQAAAVGGRPVPCNGCTVCGTYTCVHYSIASDANYADSTLQMAEESWNTEMNTQGWLAPPGDSGTGGTDQLDIYLADLNGGGAYTAPEYDVPGTNWNDATSYIVIDQNIGLGVMGAFVSHEMNHTSQFAYDYIEAANVYESTATFMEDKVYDDINDYTWYTGDFQSNPDRSVDYDTYSDVYMYGASVFMHFLSERYDNGGTTLVRDMWDRSKESGNVNEPDYIDSLHELLQERGVGSFHDAYAEFAHWRIFTGSSADTANYFEEGNLWSGVSTIASHTLQSAQGLSSNRPPMEFGANYATVSTSGGASGDRFAVTFYGDTTKAWHVLLVGRRYDGSTCLASAPADTGGYAKAFVDDLGDFSNLWLVFANLGAPGALRDPDSENYATASFSYDIDYATSASSIDINGAVACGEPPKAGGGDDDDSPVGCLCATSRPPTQGPAPASLLLALIAAAGLVLVRRHR